MPLELVYLLQSLTIVAVFGLVLWASTWLVRRWSSPRGSGPLEVIARVSLDGRRSVHLVRVGRRVLIVGTGEGVVTRLGTTSMASLSDFPEADANAELRPIGAGGTEQAAPGGGRAAESFARVWARLRPRREDAGTIRRNDVAEQPTSSRASQ